MAAPKLGGSSSEEEDDDVVRTGEPAVPFALGDQSALSSINGTGLHLKSTDTNPNLLVQLQAAVNKSFENGAT